MTYPFCCSSSWSVWYTNHTDLLAVFEHARHTPFSGPLHLLLLLLGMCLPQIFLRLILLLYSGLCSNVISSDKLFLPPKVKAFLHNSVFHSCLISLRRTSLHFNLSIYFLLVFPTRRKALGGQGLLSAWFQALLLAPRIVSSMR